MSIFKNMYFGDGIRVSNSLDPDQVRHIVGPDLDPNCLQGQKSPLARKELSQHPFTLETLLE